MPPIRRYLRISKYSVLECRIYLDNPSDSRWLLDTRDPALRRVFTSIRPLVLPKLREETERARAKKKSKPVKDVLSEGTILLILQMTPAVANRSEQMTLKFQFSSVREAPVIQLLQNRSHSTTSRPKSRVTRVN